MIVAIIILRDKNVYTTVATQLGYGGHAMYTIACVAKPTFAGTDCSWVLAIVAK
jgi:hypothetical protein